jgi:hypothetical protein
MKMMILALACAVGTLLATGCSSTYKTGSSTKTVTACDSSCCSNHVTCANCCMDEAGCIKCCHKS